MRAIRKLAPIAMVGIVVAVVAFSAYSSLTTPTLAFSFRVYWASPSVYTPGTTPPTAYLQINSTGTGATTYYYTITYNSTSGEIVAAQGPVAISELAPYRAYVYIPIPPDTTIVARAVVYGGSSTGDKVLYSSDLTL